MAYTKSILIMSTLSTIRRPWPWQIALWLWASPASCIGLALGGVGLCSGGKVRRVGPTLEFWGGTVSSLLKSRLVRARGMTLGHVILGESGPTLESIRSHEWVHVRQYERWGPLFIPAYLTSSALLWLTGRHPYWDNPFEIEAYESDLQLEPPQSETRP